MAGSDETLRMVAELVDRVSGPLRKIGAGLAAIGNTPYMTRLRTQFSTLGRAISPIGSLLKTGIVGGLAAVGVSALSAGAAITGLLAAMNSAKDRLDEFDEQAQLTGLSVQQLRELQYAMKFSGVDWGTASAALVRMNKNIGELRSGVGAYGKQVAKQEPGLYRALKRTKTTSEAFTVLHKRMSAIKDPAQRVAFAMRHFGKSGADLAKSASSVEEFTEKLERARKFRGILPDDAGEKAGALNDRIDELKYAFEGLSDAIGYQVFDAFGDVIGQVAEWIAANRDLIATGIADFLKDLGDLVKRVDWVGFGRDVLDTARSVGEFVDSIGGLKTILYSLGALIAAGPALALVQLGGVLAGLAAAVLGVPVGAVLAIAAAGVAIYRDWENVSAALGRVGEAFSQLFNAGSFEEFLTAIGNIGSAVKGVGDAINQALVKGVLDAIELAFGAGARGVVEDWIAFLNKLPARAVEALTTMYDAIDAKWQEFSAGVREAAAAFGQAIYDGIAGAVGRLSDYIGGILDGIVSKIRSVISYIPGLGSAESDAGQRKAGAIAGGALAPGGAPPIPDRPLVPGKQSSLGGPATVQGEAKVIVDFRNMPKGVSATASADGRLFKGVDVNRGAAMQPA